MARRLGHKKRRTLEGQQVQKRGHEKETANEQAEMKCTKWQEEKEKVEEENEEKEGEKTSIRKQI